MNNNEIKSNEVKDMNPVDGRCPICNSELEEKTCVFTIRTILRCKNVHCSYVYSDDE
jgi:hypothetical protein